MPRCFCGIPLIEEERGGEYKRIGLMLGINEKTVEKHLENILKKLQVASRVEAAVLAIREGLVQE
ncbi:MAG TPA: LuxR C-terminal-related transcriptional regulator [Anaerolineales bacterium]